MSLVPQHTRHWVWGGLLGVPHTPPVLCDMALRPHSYTGCWHMSWQGYYDL